MCESLEHLNERQKQGREKEKKREGRRARKAKERVLSKCGVEKGGREKPYDGDQGNRSAKT